MSTEKKENVAEAEEKEEIIEEVKETKEEVKAEAKTEKEKKPKKESKKEQDLKKAVDEAVKAERDKYLRLMAEYDNFRKRSQKERDSLYGDIKADTAAKFLPVFDNLERALAQETADEAYRRGVEMIMTQFKQTLEKLGVTEIESLGQQFNPEVHNAVMHIEDENFGENEVVEVFQKGFMLNDKVIRFAMVKVAN